ncbi:MAG: NYN domain-containing protein, partial [Proteobacteria bacterium]|nr:NYN domain-containing protein [Pseudomonadota bacterium]
MNRFAVLVDAGYLLSQSVQILSNQKSKSRKDLAIHDPQGLIAKIIEHSIEALGNRHLLRVYWYDGVAGRLSS